MKLNDLKKIIKEEIAKALNETAPVKTPAKPTTKPGTGKPGPFQPNKETTPKVRPAKAKAEDEDKDKKKTNEAASKGIANIVKKYKSLKGK